MHKARGRKWEKGTERRSLKMAKVAKTTTPKARGPGPALLRTKTDGVAVGMSMQARSAMRRLRTTTSVTCGRTSDTRAKSGQVLGRQCGLTRTSGILMAPSSSRPRTQSSNFISRYCRRTLPISPFCFKRECLHRVGVRTSKSRPTSEVRTRTSPSIASGETTADDFAALLTVIEEPMKYTDEAPPMPILAGVLRAARALEFDAQRKWAERIFERMWPAALDALTDEVIPHASAALALARTFEIHSARKRASYELLRMPALGQSIADSGVPLPHADLLRLLHAREQLCLAWAETAGKAPTEFPCLRGTESDRGPCAVTSGDRVHSRWAELVHASGVFAQRMIDPLMGLQDLVDMPWKDEGFCRKCVAARANEWADLRTKLWDNLDVWLELASE
ncbi:hypothetical protein EDB83DRAFT_496688 [Lactarius deliciosus]|nr:hypothetical protein EDB83DRAFT_496688 [Lactarius deliciosus]